MNGRRSFIKMLRTSVCAAAAAIFSVAAPSQLQAAPGDTIIIVANKTYRAGVPNVDFADRDGDEVEKAAMDARVLNIPRSSVARFNDMTQGDAAAWFQRDGLPGKELVDHLRRLPNARKDGTIYFYYSGHGISARNTERGNDELHFVLQDTRTNAIGATALSITTVQLALNAAQREFMPQGRVVLLIDACFSGVDRNNEPLWQGSRMIGPNTKVKPLARERMVTLGASAANEPAWSDAARRHGAFTDALLDGLYGRAALKDGSVTGQSLHEFVSARVTQRLARANRSQTPTIDGDPTLPIALLSTPLPERDPHLAARLNRQCAVMRASTDYREVETFLKSSCQEDCPCRPELEQRLQAESACVGEASDLDELISKGPSARSKITALQSHLTCPSVKAKAIATLEAWTRNEASSQQQAEAKAAEARKAAETKAAEAKAAETRAAEAKAAEARAAEAKAAEARAAEAKATENRKAQAKAAQDQAGADRARAEAAQVVVQAKTSAAAVAPVDTVALFDRRAVPSFDCAEYAVKPKAQRLPQTDILCIQVDAAAADTQMGNVFRAYRDRFDATTKRAVIDRQTAWIASRNARCPASWSDVSDEGRRAEIAACLITVTRARQSEVALWSR